MKKLLLALAALFLSTTLFAQSDVQTAPWKTYRHDVAIAGGPISLQEIAIGVWIELIDAIVDDAENAKSYGCLSAQYHYQLFKWMRLGGKVIYEGGKHDITKKGENIGHGYNYWTALMASAQFTYLNTKWVKLYSGLDFGVQALTMSDHYNAGHTNSDGDADPSSSSTLAAFNVTPIGITVGKQFYGLLETNVGNDALLKLGIGARF